MRVGRVTELKKNQIAGFHFEHGGMLVSRTGYTGEDGFEIVGSDEAIRHIWDALLAAGRPFGIKPCGLGARDMLAHRGLLSALRPRTGRANHAHRSRPGIFCRARQGRIQWPRRFRGTKGQGEEKTHRVQDDWEIRAATAAVSNPGERCDCRHRHQRHPKPVTRASASAWATCRRNSRNPTRRSRLKFAANRFPPLSCPSRFTGRV